MLGMKSQRVLLVSHHRTLGSGQNENLIRLPVEIDQRRVISLVTCGLKINILIDCASEPVRVDWAGAEAGRRRLLLLAG